MWVNLGARSFLLTRYSRRSLTGLPSPLKTRARWAFGTIVTLQGAWWTWSTYIQSIYQPNNALLDWSDPGFGRGFAVRPTRPHHQNQPVEPDSAFYSCTSFSQLASS
mgnify:CR=1 FL=1